MGPETIESLPSTSRSRSRIPINPIPESDLHCRIKALARIRDTKTEVVTAGAQFNLGAAGSAVLDYIVQPFLGNSEQAEFYILREIAGKSMLHEMNIDLVLLADFFAKTTQGRNQTHKV